MDVQLKITWTGDVPGLAEHRVSLAHFGKAMNLLFAAYRRIASNMLRSPELKSQLKDKRLRTSASWLDLQIEQITGGSAGLQITPLISPPSQGQFPLFERVSLRAGERLLEELEAASRGEESTQAALKYLKALPSGLIGQKYELRSGRSLKTVELGEVSLPKPQKEAPDFVEIENGEILSLGFEVHKEFIHIQNSDERRFKCSATDKQVERAVGLRSELIDAFVVITEGKPRIVKFWPTANPPKPLSVKEEEAVVFDNWEELLERLAQ